MCFSVCLCANTQNKWFCGVKVRCGWEGKREEVEKSKGSGNSLLQWVANYCVFWMARFCALAKGIARTNTRTHSLTHTQDVSIFSSPWRELTLDTRQGKMQFYFEDLPPWYVHVNLQIVTRRPLHLLVDRRATSDTIQRHLSLHPLVFLSVSIHT